MKNQPNHNNQPEFRIFPVGYLVRKEEHTCIEVLPAFIPALKELESFSHVQVIWWFNGCDDETSRKTITFDQMPFDAPELGVFACRSPVRPNPLGLTTAKIIEINQHHGLIEISNFDAYDGTPIIDLKPYLPSCDRVQQVRVAKWAQCWPEWLPESGLSLEDCKENTI